MHTHILYIPYVCILDLINISLPLIAVDKLHVHTVSAHERLAVERCVHAGGVWDGCAQHSNAREGRFGKPTQDMRWAAVAHLQMPRAMQHLTDRAATLYITSLHFFQRINKYFYDVCECSILCSNMCVLTFQLADLRLTVRPLLVTVHFILIKKSLPVLISLPFLPYTGPANQTPYKPCA